MKDFLVKKSSEMVRHAAVVGETLLASLLCHTWLLYPHARRHASSHCARWERLI